MSSRTWQDLPYGDLSGCSANVAVCNHGTIHLHMEWVTHPKYETDVPVSVSLERDTATEVAVEMLRRAHGLDGYQVQMVMDALTYYDGLATAIDTTPKPGDIHSYGV